MRRIDKLAHLEALTTEPWRHPDFVAVIRGDLMALCTTSGHSTCDEALSDSLEALVVMPADTEADLGPLWLSTVEWTQQLNCGAQQIVCLDDNRVVVYYSERNQIPHLDALVDRFADA